MLRSMTAFARHAFTPESLGGEGDGPELVWELRSVNHRFFEAVLRLPEQCRELEGALRELARSKLARGRLDASLRLQERSAPATLRVDTDALRALLSAMQELQRSQPQLNAPTVLDVLRWPGVLKEPRPDNDALLKAVDFSFRVALDSLLASRAREGAALQDVLGARLSQIADIVAELRQAAAALPRDLQARITLRLQEIETGTDPQRLAQEVALLAQRADIAEELDRLSAHLLEFQRGLARGEPVGRQLDFLAQELNREANTISSKAGSAAIAQRCIDLKVLIEQIREQVQNVE